MDLRKRLAALDKLTRRPDAAALPANPVDPQQQAANLRSLGLAPHPAPDGPIWIRESVDPVPPAALPDSFVEFFSRAAGVRPRIADLLFLDTETTGLAGGTGTLAFLVGVSWWRGDDLVTRQFFLPGPGAEPALLGALAGIADDFEIVVTFNGASYDLPLLRTRALMNRARDPLGALVSWDLLVPSRRLWGRSLANCRQQTLEEAVCCLGAREDDIDGARIPQVWFDFLADGDPQGLEAVLRHNRLDMVGMARLFGEVAGHAALLASPPAAGDWKLAWALGRIAERRRETDLAVAWMRCAHDRRSAATDGAPDLRYLADAVRILKRSGDWPLVAELIAQGLAATGPVPWLHREAAILYERRLVDLEKALAHARRCGDTIRIERLKDKLSIRKEEAGE